MSAHDQPAASRSRVDVPGRERDVLILEPRFVVSRYDNGSVRITAAASADGGPGGTVLLTPEQVRRVMEVLGVD